MHIFIRYIRPTRQTQALLKQRFTYSIDIGRIGSINRLQMHGLPQWTRFNTCGVQCHSQGLDIAVRLTIGMQRLCCVRNPGRSTYDTQYCRFVGSIFSSNM